jgi:hypothetical protein
MGIDRERAAIRKTAQRGVVNTALKTRVAHVFQKNTAFFHAAVPTLHAGSLDCFGYLVDSADHVFKVMNHRSFAQSANMDRHFFEIGWVLQEVLAAEKNHTCYQGHQGKEKIGYSNDPKRKNSRNQILQVSILLVAIRPKDKVETTVSRNNICKPLMKNQLQITSHP